MRKHIDNQPASHIKIDFTSNSCFLNGRVVMELTPSFLQLFPLIDNLLATGGVALLLKGAGVVWRRSRQTTPPIPLDFE
jgi:hypothetical protein